MREPKQLTNCGHSTLKNEQFDGIWDEEVK